MTEGEYLQRANATEDTLSEDDAIFSESDGERLDYSGEESSSDEPERRSQSKGHGKGRGNNDAYDDDDDDEEESEAVETDEDEATAKRRLAREERRRAKKAKKTKRSRFIDTEAAVGDSSEEEEQGRRGPRRRKNVDDEGDHDETEEEGGEDDEEDEEEDEEDDEDFVDKDIEERDKEFTAAFQKRLAAHAARREAARRAFEEETLNPEAVEERLRQLYGRTRRGITGTTGEPATAATLATVMQPTPSDPKLWLVKCRPGRERAAVAALMRGLTILGDNNLGIYSVVGRDSLKGFIYVEAHKAGDVMNAVQRTKTNHLIFASPINRPVMVPLGEMADVLSISMGSGAGLTGGTSRSIDSRQLIIGGWVRVKRGKYAGDLAQIVEVEQDQGVGGDTIDYVVRVKLLPRLSLRPSTRSRPGATKGDRPTARPFDPQEASQYGSVTKTRGFWIYNGEAYKDGFLHKDVRASSLLLTDVNPRPDELQRFGALALEGGGTEGEDEDQDQDETEKGKVSLTAAAKTTKAAALSIAAAMGALNKGESILVTRGEFAQLTGMIESTSAAGEPTVLVRFQDSKAFPEPVLISKRHLIRRFDTGDMIRVMYGEHAGRTGMIVSLAKGGKEAVIFTTGGDNQQFAVPLVYLIAAGVASTGDASSIGGKAGRPMGMTAPVSGGSSFDLNDLVAVEATGEEEVGLVTRLMEEEGQATILDMNGQSRTLPYAKLRRLPQVSTMGGGRGGGSAAIRHDPSTLRAGDRVQFWEGTAANVGGGGGGGGPLSSSGALSRPATIINIHRQTAFLRTLDTGELVTRPLSTISRPPAYGIDQDQDHDPDRETRHRRPPPQRHLIGKSVTISGAGPYKGYVGIVKELTDTMARVELHTDSRVVSVPRERIMLPGTGGEREREQRSVAGVGAGMARPSAWSSAAAGSRTPAWGMAGSARTPAWGSAAKTPAWGAPASSSSAGAKTPAWGTSASARTPAWGTSASGRTPAWGTSATARTPAWGTAASGKTPAWGASASARTPAAGGDGGRTPAWQSMASTRGSGSALGGSSGSGNISLPAWAIPEAEVSLRSGTGMGTRITAILAGGKVQLAGNSDPVSVADLVPVAPVKKDSVRIVGEERGATGTVIGLDGPDAVIRVDGTADFRIVPIQSLVKIARP